MPDSTMQGQAYRVYKDDESKLKTYEHRIATTKVFTDWWHPKAKQWLSRYRLTARPSQLTDTGHLISAPDSLGNIDAIYASMVAVAVDFHLKPRGEGTRPQARLATKALKQVWADTKAQAKSEKAIKDAIIAGLGWLKVNYDYVDIERTVPREEDEIITDQEVILGGALAAGAKLPTPDELNKLIPQTKKVREVVRDRVVVDYVPWDEVRWDPTAKNIEDIRWICLVTRVPEHEVKKNPGFREYVKRRHGGLKDLEDLKPDTAVDKSVIGNVKAIEDDQRITVYEMWDFETGTVCTFPKNGKFILNEAPNPHFINPDLEDKNPFVPLIVRDDPDNALGISDMRAMETGLEELDDYRTSLATHVARHVAKVIAPEGAFTESGKRALKSREHGSVVETSKEVNPEHIRDLKPPPLVAEAFQMEARVAQSIRDSIGLSELQRGLFPPRRETATATEAVAIGSTSRQSERRNLLERFYVNTARRILLLMQMFYTAPQVTRLTGEEADELWTWTGDDIASEYDLEVTVSPKEPQTAQTRRDDALMLANLALNPAAAQFLDGAEVYRYLFEEFGLPEEVIRNIIKTAEEQQQEAQAALQIEAEGALAQQGVPPNPAEVPGPLGGEELAAAANPGEVPPEMETGA